MKREFIFKAVSIGDEDNEIVVQCRSTHFFDNDLTHNIEEGKALAQYLALWLTPITTNAIVSELNKMGYHG